MELITVSVVNEDRHALVMQVDDEEKNCHVRMVDLEQAIREQMANSKDDRSNSSEAREVDICCKCYAGDFVKMN